MYPQRGQVRSLGPERTGAGVGVSPALSGGGGRACWAEPLSPRSRSAAGRNAAAAHARIHRGRGAGLSDSENDRPDLIEGHRDDRSRRVIDLECHRHPPAEIGMLEGLPQIFEAVDRYGLGARPVIVESDRLVGPLLRRQHALDAETLVKPRRTLGAVRIPDYHQLLFLVLLKANPEVVLDVLERIDSRRRGTQSR